MRCNLERLTNHPVEQEPLLMTFDDLENSIMDDLLLLSGDPTAIQAEVSQLLQGLDAPEIFAIRRLAKEISAAIALEHLRKDGDMVKVIRMLSAILEPAINWLERRGVNGRSLLSKPI
jgi:hypothetical protein